MLDSHNINTSTLKNNSLNVTYFKNLLFEVSCFLKENDINMHLKIEEVVRKNNWFKFLLLVI